MQPDDKLRLIYGAKMISLGVWDLLTIITCAGVWNFNPESFIKWCALALFIANGCAIYFFAKRLSKEYKAATKAYYESLKK